MKLVLKGALSVFALSALAFTASALAAGQAGQEPKPHDMTGCLAKGDTAGTYRLTNLEKGPKTVEITQLGKEVMKIEAHLGHRVTITGVGVPTPDKAPAGHYMRVDSFKHVSPTCP